MQDATVTLTNALTDDERTVDVTIGDGPMYGLDGEPLSDRERAVVAAQRAVGAPTTDEEVVFE